MKLGSLFDGIGGFPLSAIQHGIEPVWASEIEPFPIVVTKNHFPNMKHLGDITQINGAEIEPVEIITGGSPCQDLSVAGKRAGLAGKRSGLFMEQVRIIKEMREHDRAAGRTDKLIRPRFMVWENVPGAFSSNGGEDFRAVLEETARIADETVTIPRPRDDKWDTAGAIVGRNFSIAWRVLDAQYWGVPQRRRRIFLVADFAGHSAGEILFKCESVSGDITESREKGQETAGYVERGVNSAEPIVKAATLRAEMHGNIPAVCYPINTQVATRWKKLGERTGLGIGENGEPAYTLQAGHEHAVAYGICSDASNSMKSNNPHSGIYEADTSRTIDQNGGNPACNQGGMAIVQCIEPGALSRGQGERVWDKCPTLRAKMGDNQPCVVLNDQGGSQMSVSNDVVGALRAEMHGNIPAVTTYSFQQSDEFKETDRASTQSRQQYKDATDLIVSQRYSVRRLTPTECERLQGFPDDWTNIPGTKKVSKEELEFWRGVWYEWDKMQSDEPEKIKPRNDRTIIRWLKNPTSDTAQYKALGNSVAVPCTTWIMGQIAKRLKEEKR